MRSLEQIFRDTFASIDITINGDKPWDIQVHNSKLYERIVSGGSLAFGESYMEGWWDCEALDEFFFRVFHHRLHKKLPILNYNFIFLALNHKHLKSRS